MCKYIKATDAMDLIHRLTDMPYSDLVDPLAAVPAANVVPEVHGKWAENHDYLKCPECDVMVKRDFVFFDNGDWNYCGAKMDGEVEELPHE